MRLSLEEVKIILKYKNEIFSNDAKIYLFGSRVDDVKKGGDIDLYIEAQKNDNLFEKKIVFLRKIKEVLGEQKIDVVFSTDSNRLIEIEAKKGIELTLNSIKLTKYFNECDKHLQRIEEAYGDIYSKLPISVDKYNNLTKDEVQAIDQYLYRFSKLQDTIGDKIFSIIVEEYQSSIKTMPFIDKLNNLEKLGFISSAKEWIKLREIRNNISHQYDDEPEEMAPALTAMLNQKDIIKEIYLKLKDKAKT